MNGITSKANLQLSGLSAFQIAIHIAGSDNNPIFAANEDIGDYMIVGANTLMVLSTMLVG